MGYFVELLKGVGYLKKFCFKFGLKVYNWLLFFNMEVFLNFVLKLKIESRWKFIEKWFNEFILEKFSGFMRRMSEFNIE